MAFTRRRWLAAAGTALAAAACKRSAKLVVSPDVTVDALIQRFVEADAEGVSEIAAAALLQGVSRERVLAAAFLVPVVTSGDRDDVHAVLVVPSIAHLSETRPSSESFPAIAWAANNAHAWIGPDRRGAAAGASSESIDALLAAIRAGDAEAGRMAEGLCSRGETEQVVARLIVEGSRPRVDPHAAIYVAQALRGLDGPASQHAPRVWGSVARLLSRARTEGASPEPLRTLATDATSATDVALALRRAPATRLEGLSASAIWGALALLTIETMAVDDSVSGVGPHRVTLLDALAELYRRAPEADRGLVLSRAAAWIPRPHGLLGAAARPPVTTLVPDAEGWIPGPNPHGDTVLRRALGSAAKDAEQVIAAAQRHALAHGTGEHDFKHPAAILTLEPHVPAEVRPLWLASVALSFVMRSEGRWARREKVEALLRDRR